MDLISLLIIGLVSGGLIFLLSSFAFFFTFFSSKRKIKNQSLRLSKIERERNSSGRPSKLNKGRHPSARSSKIEREYKQVKIALNRLNVKRKKMRNRGIIFFILSVGLLSGALYTLYYQSMNLTSKDEQEIVRAYFLVRDFQKEIEKAGTQEENEEASIQNIRYLSTSMASYSIIKSSTLNTVEGQLAINRYYSSLTQLGLNATRESTNFYGNVALVEEFQKDITKIIENEKVAFDYFKINQSILEAEGAANEK